MLVTTIGMFYSKVNRKTYSSPVPIVSQLGTRDSTVHPGKLLRMNCRSALPLLSLFLLYGGWLIGNTVAEGGKIS